MQKINRRTFFSTSALTGAGVCTGALLEVKPTSAAATGPGIQMPETQIPVTAEADVVVIGGGPAGFGAAMRAARSGVKTLLIERFGGPGGAATSGYMCVTGEGGFFLPRKINNLLLAGECLSCTHDWFYGYRLIPWCMRTGEVAATAAVMALNQGVPHKAIKWTAGYFTG